VEGWRYFAAVIDHLSQSVVGLSTSATMTAQLVMATLVMAIWRRLEALCDAASLRSRLTHGMFQRATRLRTAQRAAEVDIIGPLDRFVHANTAARPGMISIK